ncbi:microsomal glutathione S-transferase 3-like [Argiope bruennichi]|uniref:Glutathione S-transferase 3, mitochondrial n=1 Tax=Argiope bruennichi TaxID=94029 RepID=A0A8T0FSG3_ARGBR|nr:microsomal glutathione S-transferase 3-like [Argiope bruennichi]KAF8794031.1 Microsomal glutathione S-transferase 3 like protein [Argiope bruennichi]
MALTIAIDEDYGYVIVVGVLSMLFGYGLGANVFFARKRFGIKYPAMYSDTNMQFNCMQRVHANYLEMFPTFLALLFCGGLAHPFYCAIAGLIYLLGRLVYSIGYSSGDPQKRLFGLFMYLGLIYLLYSTLELALRLMRWI